MNSGKSTLMNLITKSNVSIVDSKPGTTADVKITFMEIHGIGPVRLSDTPGINEEGDLGEKKRQKAFNTLKESDLVIIVVNPFDTASVKSAQELLKLSKEREKTVLVLFNITKIDTLLNEKIESVEKDLSVENSKAFNLNSESCYPALITSIQTCFEKVNPLVQVELLPKLPKDSILFMNIPMDEETPTGRLLKPQAMIQEWALKNEISTFCYRMDLRKGRSKDLAISNKERERYQEKLALLGDKVKLMITDSQAVDLVHPWTKAFPVDWTTFSIAMINQMSGGRLPLFVQGLQAFNTLQPGDRILICEACNHNRIIDDIGTVQIPNKLAAKYGNDIKIDFSFGREYQAMDLSRYKLLLHCGGCMLDQQKMISRIKDMESFGIPITNYGLVLSYLNSPETLKSVLKPWGLK